MNTDDDNRRMQSWRHHRAYTDWQENTRVANAAFWLMFFVFLIGGTAVALCYLL